MTVDPRFYSAVSQRPGPREHLQVYAEDIGEYVLLPGDPARAEVIAARLDDSKEIAWSREFRTFTGTLDGARVSVTSTGIGGPSAAIAVEELAQLGAHTFLRIGTCGALQADVHVGSVIVATAAVRDEGTTRQYAPIAYPAVASVDVVHALLVGARDLDVMAHAGVVHTTDTYYGQHEPQRMPVAARIAERHEAWTRLGVLCSEMETATVLVVGYGVHHRRAGSILAVAGNKAIGENLDNERTRELRDLAVERAVDVAVLALRRLIAEDQRR